jgi:hypothetical protein
MKGMRGEEKESKRRGMGGEDERREGRKLSCGVLRNEARNARE